MEKMGIFTRMRLFQKAAAGLLIVFMGIMVFVTIVAYNRPSGSTRQDMSQAQLLRRDASLQAAQQTPRE